MKSTTFGLNTHQLANLIRLGMTGDPGESDSAHDDNRAQLLQSWMQEKLPVEALPTKTSPAAPERNVLPLDQQIKLPLGKLLGSGIALELLMALKDFAKHQVNHADQQDVRDVATVVYYATIACALVEHQQMITSTSKERLSQAMETLIVKPWIGREIRDLLEKALKQSR